MTTWWEGLDAVNRAFYGAAIFFGVLFVWQMIMAFIGISAEGAEGAGDADADMDADADVDADGTYEHFEHGAEGDVSEGFDAFKLLGLRSVLTFFTLFTWGTALYRSNGVKLTTALMYSVAWGLAGMFIVALLFYWMRKLTESGNIKIVTCVGTAGEVYLDIPEGGRGEIRVTVSGVVSYVKARASDGTAIEAGTPVKVTRKLSQTSVEVEKAEKQ